MNPVADILLVEDNPGDVLLIRKAFERSGIAHRLHAVEDGEAAMAFLRREHPWHEAPEPSLVLLDLNLPRMDGREVLREIKADPELRHLPVVVLSNSTAEADILISYGSYANSYLPKPATLAELQAAIESLHSYWFSTVRLPARELRP